jgi:predicted dinucleotide-binding enzyme
MKVGFIGIGNVGGTLAKRFGANGHSIYLGSRDLSNEEAQALSASIGAHAKVDSIESTIKNSDVLVLATPWSAVEKIAEANKAALKGKILIDCTNPLRPDLSGLVLSGDISGGEFLQALLPETHVVKAFNTVGFNIMTDPSLSGRKSVMYFCGNNEAARHAVRTLIHETGLEPIDSGDIKASRLLEPFALLWISSAYRFGLGREFAFSIIRR